MSKSQWPTFDAEIVAERAVCERLRSACERDRFGGKTLEVRHELFDAEVFHIRAWRGHGR